MSDSKQSTRRGFLKGAATVAGTTLAAGLTGCAASPGGEPAKKGPGDASKKPAAKASVYAAEIKPGPHGDKRAPRRDKLRVAFIGTGGIGGYHIETTKEMGNVVCPCYCDVDTRRMGKAAEAYPDAKQYQDYREMFEKESDNFDAVMVGTPDHSHYPATVLALKHKKHVYTQKPLTYSVWEARQLAEMAKKVPVATQMGNQGHSMNGWRMAYEWIHGGAIGDILETHTWTNRPIWPQGIERPEGEDPIPAELNWDAWLGPAPVRPFKDGVYHPFRWRGWWDFGAGALGDMACHTMDGVFAIFDPGSPTSVEPLASTPITADAFPNASMIKWEFPERNGRHAFNAYWYDGGLLPARPPELEGDRKLPVSGNLFVGTKGTMLISGDYLESPRIIPESRMKEVGKPKQLLERSPGQIQEWVAAGLGEKPLNYSQANFTYAGPMTEVIQLGNVALRVGRKIEWDGANMRVTNVPEANQYIKRIPRPGFDFTL